MTPKLSPLLEAMVAAKNRHDSVAFTACFSSQAVVRDEQHEHRGKPAIKAWFEDVSKKYRDTLKPTKMVTRGTKTVLTALVSGDFPGSPFPFFYHFTITGGKISALSIKA